MARKIILFLSEYKGNAQEKSYRCPVGEDIAGTQTNEAPVKYLLRQYGNVEEILCIVTSKAKETAWLPFQDMIARTAQDVALTEIPYEEGDDFTDGPLTGIMEKVQAGDEVLLETTGGFRNAVMDLLLLSRILSYTGVKTIGAVYSNYPKAEIEDLSHLIGFFDLVGGMQELTSFGSVKTLRAYYGQTEEPKIESLLSAMENLYETITLCKAKRIDECMQTFDAALTDAETCGDMMMRQLLPAFRKKFGKKLTTPGLIKWCIQSDMLQQAVTVYTERIPAFVIECGHFIEVTPFARTPEVKEYEDAAAVQFMRDFMTLSKKPGPKRHPLRELNDNSPMVYVDTIENMENMLISSGYRLRCPVSQMQQICRDYLYIKTARNMMNHANDSATQDQQELVDYLTEYGYAALEDMSAETLYRAILQGVENLRPIPKKGESALKKFITVIPLQVQGQLRQYHYQAVGNRRLQMDRTTSFPILTAVNGYVEQGETFRLLAIVADSEDGRRNCAALQNELEELCKAKNCPCPTIDVIAAPSDERVVSHVAVFQKLIDCVEDDDELFACITYGTKPLSQAVLLAVQYAYRIKKNASISCVVYGQIDRSKGRNPESWTAQAYDETALLQLGEVVRVLAERGATDPKAAINTILSL